MSQPTLLAVLAHPDDEVLCAGTLLAQRAAGSRVVILWLTRGEMTDAWGPLPTAEVAERRMELGMQVAQCLGVEGRFLSFPDSAVEATPEAGDEVARVMAEIKPSGLITWGDAWTRGFRHPDHQATGKIARDAVNFARIAKVVAPEQPHRAFCPIFTLRGVHSSLPAVALDVGGYADKIFEVAEIYRRAIGFGAPEWIEGRLRSAGSRWDRDLVEEFDAWETGSGLVDRLLPHRDGPFFITLRGKAERGPDRSRIAKVEPSPRAMSAFVLRTRLNHAVGDVFAWHMRPGALERLIPPWESVTIKSREGTPATGGRVTFRVRRGAAEVTFEVRHTDFEPDHLFRNEQVRGPFTRWVHTHRFEPDDGGGCVVEDHVDWELPMGATGRQLGGSSVEVELERLFTFRHRRLGDDLDRIKRHGDEAPLAVGVTGSSGLIGRTLCNVLTTGGHRVVRVVRNLKTGKSEDALWDPIEGTVEEERLEGLDAVVHLAGEPLLGLRWTEEKKKRIWASRIEGTEHIARALARLRRPPRVLVSASAVGFYGNRGDQRLSEDSKPGKGFLAKLCQAWEAATSPAARMGIRVAHLRIGLTLTPSGGALGTMILPFKVGIGGRIGSGRQYVGWIDHDDLLSLILHVIRTPSIRGAVNATAPHAVPNSTFTGTLGRVLDRPTFLPLPALALKALLGEMGKEMLLQGQRVQPTVAEKTGFEFMYPGLEESLRHQLGRAASP